MRRQLMEAAKSGDIELLRVLMDAQPEQPAVSFGDPGDPIEYLKALSSDADGREILAILLEVLESGFVHSRGRARTRSSTSGRISPSTRSMR